MVEHALRQAVKAFNGGDEVLAAEVRQADREIDRAEIDLEEECLKILALYQPVATDLRFIVAVLKINNDLERIGDLAGNIAEQVGKRCTMEYGDPPFDADSMAERVIAMVKHSLDSLIRLDPALARSVLCADDEVDEAKFAIQRKVAEAIQAQPSRTACLLQVLLVARHLERIADHATNIAEDVVYLTEGEIIRHGG